MLVTLADNQTSVPAAASRIIYYASSGASKTPEVDGVGSFGGNESGGRTVRVVGAGFALGTGTPTVTFGGVPGTDVAVQNDHHLTVVVPPYSASDTTCATALNPATDVCQVQVQVTTTEGSSAESTILPEFAGDLSSNDPNAEEFPAATEFDYLPTPTITSITVDSGLAVEPGGSMATIKGTGLGILGLDWINVGAYQDESSQDRDLLATGTGAQQGKTVTVVLPAIAPTVQNATVQVTAQTEGSTNITSPGGIAGSPPSNHRSVTYVGIPSVSSIAALNGCEDVSYTAGPQTGGTQLVINGAGLDNTGLVLFTDVGKFGGPYGVSDATSYSFSANPTKITMHTPSDNPGVDQVSACSLSGCSPPVKHDTFTFYPNGNPRVSSIKPGVGQARQHGDDHRSESRVHQGGVLRCDAVAEGGEPAELHRCRRLAPDHRGGAEGDEGASRRDQGDHAREPGYRLRQESRDGGEVHLQVAGHSSQLTAQSAHSSGSGTRARPR